MTAREEDEALLEVDDELPDVEEERASPGTVIRPTVPFCVTVPLTRSTISPELIVPVTDFPVTEL